MDADKQRPFRRIDVKWLSKKGMEYSRRRLAERKWIVENRQQHKAGNKSPSTLSTYGVDGMTVSTWANRRPHSQRHHGGPLVADGALAVPTVFGSNGDLNLQLWAASDKRSARNKITVMAIRANRKFTVCDYCRTDERKGKTKYSKRIARRTTVSIQVSGSTVNT